MKFNAALWVPQTGRLRALQRAVAAIEMECHNDPLRLPVLRMRWCRMCWERWPCQTFLAANTVLFQKD